MPARPGLGPCSVEGCDRDVFARGWCSLHYNRWRRSGDVGSAEPKRKLPSADGRCVVDGCEEPAHAHRLCNRHLKRLQTTGETGPAESLKARNAGLSCKVEGCGRSAEKREMCGMHYLRWRQTGDPGEAGSRYMTKTPDGLCAVEGCGKPVRDRQLCTMHGSRLRVKGILGPANPLRRKGPGNKYKTPDGYVMMSVPGHPGASRMGYVLEHRLVMEKILGRKLLPRETVHHKNGVRDDNRPENLELWVKPQPAGQRVADLVTWVVENYPDYVAAAIASHPGLVQPQ